MTETGKMEMGVREYAKTKDPICVVTALLIRGKNATSQDLCALRLNSATQTLAFVQEERHPQIVETAFWNTAKIVMTEGTVALEPILDLGALL